MSNGAARNADTEGVLWSELHNARDLGGLPTSTGTLASGRLFRSPHLDDLSEDGWAELRSAGIRTVIDLRNDDEVAHAVARVTRVHCPIEDQSDAGFMDEFGALLATPRYYAEALSRWPWMFARVFRTIAEAESGGILVHCAAGRDRTGQIIAMLLTIADVTTAAVLDDYELSMREMNDYARLGLADEKYLPPALMNPIVADNRAALGAFLDEVDMAGYLLSAGLSGDELSRLHARMTAAVTV